jgi:hypothetical protein
MNAAGFESELRELEKEIIRRYDRRTGSDRRVSSIRVPVDFRLYGRRRDDECTTSFLVFPVGPEGPIAGEFETGGGDRT